MFFDSILFRYKIPPMYIDIIFNKAIEEKCRKSTWHCSFSRLEALRVKKQETCFRYGLGECVYQFSGLYLISLLAKRRRTDPQTNRHTYLKVKIGKSSTGCSPHVDFYKSHIGALGKYGLRKFFWMSTKIAFWLDLWVNIKF